MRGSFVGQRRTRDKNRQGKKLVGPSRLGEGLMNTSRPQYENSLACMGRQLTLAGPLLPPLAAALQACRAERQLQLQAAALVRRHVLARHMACRQCKRR